MIWTLVWFAVAAVVVAVDQITKVIAVKYLVGNPIVVIPKVLNFTYVENDGMALGMLDDQRWIFMTLSTVAILGMIVYMIGWKPKSKLACASLALIIGGGIGNMIDRFFYVGIQGETVGEKVVRDFIDVRMFGELWPWVFNVADACVCVGGGLLFVWCVVSLIKESIAERAVKTMEKEVLAAAEKKAEESESVPDQTEEAADQQAKEE